MSATRALLVLFVLGCLCNEQLFMLSSWGRVAGPWSGKAQQLGTPLSNDEYRQFFRSLRAAHRASTACHLRMLYGCQNPLVRRLDEYENHGIIPKGPICSELTETSFFPNFCAFAFYRCTTKRYFIKRTACPGEHKANLGSTQTFNNMALSSDAELSATFSPQPIFLTSPATTQPSSSSPNMEGAGISSSSPDGTLQLRSMQPSASHPAEVTVSSQQQGQLPTTDIEDLLLRLQDSHVQSLVHTMKQLLAMGKAVMEEELQAAALRLLVALNNASVSQGANSTDTQHGRKT
ncbi:acrosin-binding protein-like isoform X2 [Numida meleagris]|uniref:acrosin-binding protein-like isoform X2 n=2 Tax=Numida meleagris TaxID=8996 RepID=UPI000B3DFCCE|nr:acrosin-binding protein-like isoform X2 [Numida meleagris]